MPDDQAAPKILNMTPLRRRVLAALEQRGPIRGQDLAYEFAATRRQIIGAPFKTPQMATRWSAAFMGPLLKAGLVTRWGVGLGGEYRITGPGKRRNREAVEPAEIHDALEDEL